MAWVTPRVWTVGEQATAAKLNEISAALNDLDRRTSPAGATVNTIENTSSLSYTDLFTPGPAVTVTIGSTGKALVAVYCALSNSSANFALASYAVSGASTVAAADTQALQTNTTSDIRVGFTVLHTGLVPGSNTFTMKYRASTSGPAAFNGRRILVNPLGS